MKGRFTTILATLLLLVGGTASAQLLIGPSVSGGLTYGKNFIVSDTSQYHLPSSMGTAFSGGLDILYQFDENWRLSVGGAYRYKNLVLEAPAGREGLSFSQIERTATAISIPITVQYRVPILGGTGKYLNFIVGHSLDITSEDSVVIKTPNEALTSGSYTRHEFINLDRTIPTVLLGAGLDFQSEGGNVLNITAMWNLGTGKILEGNISEWEELNSPFDPTVMEEPEEFPEHYFDFALKGSTISLQLSYYFNLGNPFSGGDKDQDTEESLIED